MTSATPPMPPGTDTYAAARSRPGTVTAAAVIGIIQAVLSAISGLLFVSIKAIVKNHNTSLTTSEQSTLQVVGAIVLVISVVLLIGSIGLLREREWARITVVVIEGLAVLDYLVSIFRGEAGSVVGLALAAVVIGLLLSGGSRAYFAAGPGR